MMILQLNYMKNNLWIKNITSLFQKDKANILTLKSLIVQLYKYFIYNTTFIYYSKTRWDLLFQRRGNY